MTCNAKKSHKIINDQNMDGSNILLICFFLSFNTKENNHINLHDTYQCTDESQYHT